MLDAISADVMSPAEMSAVQGRSNVVVNFFEIPTTDALASMLYKDRLGKAMVMLLITEDANESSLLFVEVMPLGLNGL